MTSLSKLEVFVARVQREMSAQGKIPADIARTGIVTDAAVSKLFGLQQKTVGYKMMSAISAALDVPLDVVKEWAGFEVDGNHTEDEVTRKAQHLISNYKRDETRKMALSYLQHLADEEKKGQAHGAASSKRSASTKNS